MKRTLLLTIALVLAFSPVAWGASGDMVVEGREAAEVKTVDLTATGDVTIDTPTFFVGNTDNYIGMGSATSNTNNQLHIIMTASKDILIDGSTNPRAIDTGTLRFEQKPSIENTRAVTINLDINGQPSSHAQVTNIVATGLVAGETATAYDTNVDRSTSTGGIVRGYEMSISGTGSAVGHLMHADPGIVPISHFSGTFGAVSQAWGEDGSFPDLTISFNTDGTDATIFPANADNIFIGMDAVFDEIEVDLLTFAGGAGIKPTFHYSSGGGAPVWTPYTPQDETQGMRQDGVINWFVSDLTTPTWALSTINGSSKYWIRITRTQVSIPVDPVEKTIQVSSTTTYSWDENGDLTISDLSAARISRGKSTLTVTGPTDDLDVSGINVVQVNTNGNNVTIGAFTGGVDGQQLAIVIVEASNNTILEHNEGTGNQNIFLESAADETKTATYGGWILECDGSNWYQTGGGGGGGGVSAGSAVFTGEIAYADPTTHTTTLTGFHAGNQTQTANITSLPGDNVTVRRLRVYISTDPTASENDQFRLSFYSDDGYTEDDLLWSDFFNLTYSEVLTAQWNSTDTSGDIDTSAGLVKYDLIRMLGGTPENQRVTAITDADTIAFTALVGNHAVDEGVVRVYEYTDAFMLFDDDDSAEIHAKLENFGTFAASASVVIEVDIQ